MSQFTVSNVVTVSNPFGEVSKIHVYRGLRKGDWHIDIYDINPTNGVAELVYVTPAVTRPEVSKAVDWFVRDIEQMSYEG